MTLALLSVWDKTGILSVWDKTGIIDLAKALAAKNIGILSSGGTAKTLREAGIPVKDVSEYTGFPEMMDGRVKTLHPKVHGGLLGRRGIDDARSTALKALTFSVSICIRLRRCQKRICRLTS